MWGNYWGVCNALCVSIILVHGHDFRHFDDTVIFKINWPGKSDAELLVSTPGAIHPVPIAVVSRATISSSVPTCAPSVSSPLPGAAPERGAVSHYHRGQRAVQMPHPGRDRAGARLQRDVRRAESDTAAATDICSKQLLLQGTRYKCLRMNKRIRLSKLKSV